MTKRKWLLTIVPVALVVVVAVALGVFLSLRAHAQAGPLKVDFGRANTAPGPDPSYEQWMLKNELASDTRTMKGVTFVVEALGTDTARLRADWWKEGVTSHPEAKVASDGITIEEGIPGAEIQLKIAGLKAGPHTLLTYHNTWQNPEKYTFSKVNVSLNGVQKVAGLEPSNRVMRDLDSQMSYLEFDAEEGKDVVVLYQSDPESSVTQHNVTIAGFEIDTPDPRVQPPASPPQAG